MNKFSILLIVMLSFSASYAQDESNIATAVEDKKHEVRLSTLKLLAGGIIEGSYEYILDENQGFGSQLLVNLNKNSDYIENFSVTPYYRFYFQTKEDYGARGFFVEGFSSFFLSDFELDNNIETIDSDNVFDISLGIALGIKWLNTTGFVFEIKAGGGRNVLGNASFEGLFKGDFSIGYRF